MAPSIKNAEAERLSRELARERGTTVTAAVIGALEGALLRDRGRKGAPSVEQTILKVSERSAALPDLDTRSSDKVETLLARERERTRRVERRLAHTALAAHLLAAPKPEAQALVARARAVVDRWERERLCSRHYISRWRKLLAGPVRRVARELLQTSAWTDALFQNTPWSFAFPVVKRDHLRHLFARARDPCGHTDYVLLGSLAVLGCTGTVPFEQTTFLDKQEGERARRALEDDRRWLEGRTKPTS